MKILFLLSIVILSGCSYSQRAARDCENLGYVKGTTEFTECSERQLAARREADLEFKKQKAAIAIEREKASHGLFGRTPICNTSSMGNGVYTQNCQ